MNKFFLCFFLLAVFAYACSEQATQQTIRSYEVIRGETMGTYYAINLENIDNIVNKRLIDSLLIDLNNELSTYIPTSVISVFNQADVSTLTVHKNSGMAVNLLAALEIAELSAGAFDPTVMPLVNYWGFGYTPKKAIVQADSLKIDSLLEFVGFRKIQIQQAGSDSILIVKEDSRVQLDFSAIAKGYGTDLVADLLVNLGIENFMVDIGGEVLAKGRNRTGGLWRLGISTPDREASEREVELVLLLDNASIATSGNYRNFHVIADGIYAHTINPVTGYPEMSNILSATILAENAMLADAYATTAMVLGYPAARDFIENLPDTEALFILGGDSTEQRTLQYTEGMKALIAE